MSATLTVIQDLQAQFEEVLQRLDVRVFFSRNLEEGEDGRYCDNGTIFVNYALQGNDEEILKVIAHESVHHLQYSRRILLGTLPPHYWNPNIPEDTSLILEQSIKEVYPPEDWDYEIPAFSLQYKPRKVLELLLNS